MKKLMKDYDEFVINLIRNEERSIKTGWSNDFDSAPLNKWILLQSGTDDTLIYMGKLQKLSNGTVQRKISKTPWRVDADERFFRDSIVAWFDATNILGYLIEATHAAMLSSEPVISCTKVNNNGSISIAYKKHTVPEYRRFVTLNG